MSGSARHPLPPTARRVLELALTAAGFGSVYGVYLRFFNNDLLLDRALLGCLASILAFWLASQLRETQSEEANPGPAFLEHLFFGAGITLLVHSLVTYVLLTRRTPFLVVGGSLAASVMVTAFRYLAPSVIHRQPRILLIGYDALCERLLGHVEDPVTGVWGTCGVEPPAGMARLGASGEGFAAVVAQTHPTLILISLPDWEAQVSAGDLLNCRLAGIAITDCAALYEKIFSRVCCERLQPVDLMLSSSLRGDSRTMAIQAVYNNLIGLVILLAALPFMVGFAAAILLTSGPGPAIESIECAGFQYIPFRLQRFRTTRADGSRTSVGQVLRRLRLVNLPQLINVVRGDMALVGPRPVRTEFARQLAAQVPFYGHRFSVKPGFGGWAQMHLAGKADRDTLREIEYDLFYIKESSLWLDLEILVQRLLGAFAPQAASPATSRGAARAKR